jgi:hypothetical protein
MFAFITKINFLHYIGIQISFGLYGQRDIQNECSNIINQNNKIITLSGYSSEMGPPKHDLFIYFFQEDVLWIIKNHHMGYGHYTTSMLHTTLPKSYTQQILVFFSNTHNSDITY